MKNCKRILAILGIIILVGLYLATLIFALIDHPVAFECMKISIGFTILVPVLLWIYIAMYKYLEQRKNPDTEHSDSNEE